MMQALPKQVKIGPLLYEVTEEARVANESLWGQIVYAEAKIELNPGMTAQHRRITLWHEVLHGMLIQGGIREHDERILDVLAHGIVGVLQDNPELAK
jgi:hypothetical protein